MPNTSLTYFLIWELLEGVLNVFTCLSMLNTNCGYGAVMRSVWIAWQDLNPCIFIISHFINFQNKQTIFIWLLYEYLKLRYAMFSTHAVLVCKVLNTRSKKVYENSIYASKLWLRKVKFFKSPVLHILALIFYRWQVDCYYELVWKPSLICTWSYLCSF